jgi:hypothetical protein
MIPARTKLEINNIFFINGSFNGGSVITIQMYYEKEPINKSDRRVVADR